MRLACLMIALVPGIAVAYGETPVFDAAREVLETRCLECHTAGEAKGGLVMETREGMILGGDSGTACAGKPGRCVLALNVFDIQ